MPQRILFVQLADVGDLILASPAMAALRAAHPDSYLALLAHRHAVPVLEDGLVDEIISLERRSFNATLSFVHPATLRLLWGLRGRFDCVIFLHHFTLRWGLFKFIWMARIIGAPQVLGLDNGRANFLTASIEDSGFGVKHQAQYWLDLVALLGADPKPQRARVGFAEGVLPLPAPRGLRIVIHPGSGGYSQARRWPLPFFAQVADALHEQYQAELVLVGTPEDGTAELRALMKSPAVDLSGKTSLTQLADLLRSADLFIGADSGVMHLAAAVRAPLVAIFGPSNPHAWGPWTQNSPAIIVRSTPECSPCSYVGHGLGARHGCAARTCMRMVEPAQVLQAARDILDGQPLERYALPPMLNIPANPDRVHILGVPVDRIGYTEWMTLIDRWVRLERRPHHVCTVNPEFVMIAQRDPIFMNILRRADLCLADGVGLLWAGRMLNRPFPERVTGSDGTVVIAQHAQRLGWKLFLLGAAPGVADRVAEMMRTDLPGIQVVGVHAGSPAPEEEEEIVRMINWSGADVLLVAYGAPEQDKWIARNLPRLQVKMAMGIGGALDFIAGIVPRAPQRMRDLGLEWLYRLYKQPWRIKRMMRLPHFVIAFLLRRTRGLDEPVEVAP